MGVCVAAAVTQQTIQEAPTMGHSKEVALSLQQDSILLSEMADQPLIKRISKGFRHNVDADGDLILGYSTDSPTASVDVSLGQARSYFVPAAATRTQISNRSIIMKAHQHRRLIVRGGWHVHATSCGG